MTKNVLNWSYGTVTAIAPTHSGQTLVRVKTLKKGNLFYYVDVCHVEEGQRLNPNQVIGTLETEEQSWK